MGCALGNAWKRAGYNVRFAPRYLMSLGQCIIEADVIVLTVPYYEIPKVMKDWGGTIINKSLILDVSNPRLDRDGEIGRIAQERGAGLFLSDFIPGARIVRGFNAVRAAKVGEYGAAGRTVPLAGDDKEALALAAILARDIGFKPVVVGDLKVAGKLLPYGTGLDANMNEAELIEFVRRMP